MDLGAGKLNEHVKIQEIYTGKTKEYWNCIVYVKLEINRDLHFPLDPEIHEKLQGSPQTKQLTRKIASAFLSIQAEVFHSKCKQCFPS